MDVSMFSAMRDSHSANNLVVVSNPDSHITRLRLFPGIDRGWRRGCLKSMNKSYGWSQSFALGSFFASESRYFNQLKRVADFRAPALRTLNLPPPAWHPGRKKIGRTGRKSPA